jgi:hypothetical protein
MTAWSMEGFVDESLSLNGKYLPPPPADVEPTSLWGVDDHVRACFGAAGIEPEIERKSVYFVADSVEHAVQKWADDLGPCVMARRALEPQGRWDDYMTDFEDIVRRFAEPADGGIRIESIYLVIRARP